MAVHPLPHSAATPSAHVDGAPRLPMELFELTPPRPAEEFDARRPPQETNHHTYVIRDHKMAVPFKFLRAAGDGAAKRPRLLLLHGMGLHIASFRGLARWLLPERDLILVDYTCFGIADGWPRGGVAIEELVRLCMRVPTALGIAQLDIGGASLGGGMALMAALDFPTLVRRVVLWNPAIFPQALPPLYRVVRIPVLGELVMSLMPARRLVDGIRYGGYANPQRADPELLAIYGQTMGRRRNRLRLLDIIRRLPTRSPAIDRYLQRARQLFQPVLLIWGEQERLLPADAGERLRRLLPRVEYRGFADLCHLSGEEAPDRIGPVVVEFLRRQLPEANSQ